jgi:hypothetical protein
MREPDETIVKTKLGFCELREGMMSEDAKFALGF